MLKVRFLQARKANGWSTNEMAKRMDVSAGTIRHWETGKYYPSLEKVEQMSIVTGFSIPYLLGYDAVELELKAPIPDGALVTMHGNPVWTRKTGWGLVNSFDGTVILADNSSIPIEQVYGDAMGIPPAFSLPVYGYGEPMSPGALLKAERIWVEPIGADEHLRRELRGWYRPYRNIFVENEIGQRWYLDTYGAKWLAFEEDLALSPPDENI